MCVPILLQDLRLMIQTVARGTLYSGNSQIFCRETRFKTNRE